MKDPAFLFYSQDFITGTLAMPFDERGKYITLLCYQHQTGRMSEETICFLVGSISVNLKSKFKQDENGLFYNERLEKETEKRNKYIESRISNGIKGGRPKNENKPYAKPYGKAKNNLIENENENEIIDVNKDEKQKRKKKEFVAPSIDEVKKYFKDNSYTEQAAERMFNYYSVADWNDSKGNKVNNWKQKAQAVWFKDENKMVTSQRVKIPIM